MYNLKTLFCATFAVALFSCNSNKEEPKFELESKGTFKIENAKAGALPLEEVKGTISLDKTQGDDVTLSLKDFSHKKDPRKISMNFKIKVMKKDEMYNITLKEMEKGKGQEIKLKEKKFEFTFPLDATAQAALTNLGLPALTGLEFDSETEKMTDYVMIKSKRENLLGMIKRDGMKSHLEIRIKFKGGKKANIADNDKFIAAMKDSPFKSTIQNIMSTPTSDATKIARKNAVKTLLDGYRTKLKNVVWDQDDKELSIDAYKEYK